MTLAGKLIGSTRNLQNSLNGGNNTTTSKTFIYGNGLEKIGDAKAITSSHGDIKKLLNTAGSLIAEYAYDAFGNILSTVATINPTAGSFINDILYASEQYDDITETYYLRARMYSPSLGRFKEEDTYFGDGRNLYTYAGNNPIKYVDPSGHCCAKIVGGISNILRGLGTGMVGVSAVATAVAAAAVIATPIGVAVLIGTAVAGAAAVLFGSSDVIEGIQDVVKGITGDYSTSYNIVRDTAFVGNEEYYYYAEALAAAVSSAGMAYLEYGLAVERAVNASGPSKYTVDKTNSLNGQQAGSTLTDAQKSRLNQLDNTIRDH